MTSVLTISNDVLQMIRLTLGLFVDFALVSHIGRTACSVCSFCCYIGVLGMVSARISVLLPLFDIINLLRSCSCFRVIHGQLVFVLVRA